MSEARDSGIVCLTCGGAMVKVTDSRKRRGYIRRRRECENRHRSTTIEIRWGRFMAMAERGMRYVRLVERMREAVQDFDSGKRRRMTSRRAQLAMAATEQPAEPGEG